MSERDYLSTMDACLLGILNRHGPLHALGVIQQAAQVKYGKRVGLPVKRYSAYNGMAKLEAKGLVKAASHTKRGDAGHNLALYEVTPAGLAALREHVQMIKAIAP